MACETSPDHRRSPESSPEDRQSRRPVTPELIAKQPGLERMDAESARQEKRLSFPREQRRDGFVTKLRGRGKNICDQLFMIAQCLIEVDGLVQ
jgi:hypothetical protein